MKRRAHSGWLEGQNKIELYISSSRVAQIVARGKRLFHVDHRTEDIMV
jgi:hypothetical protein